MTLKPMENPNISAELKGHFLRLYQIALSDEDFSPIEMQLLYNFAKEREISKKELDNILISHTGVVSIPNTVEKRIEYLFDFAKMIWADNIVTEDEYNALKKYCRKFEFLEENISTLADYLIQSAKESKTKETILKELEN
ncbi:hypothetical protein [Ulvibacter antarcticus]|uniref:Tellurite resistance protein TerB n=1 Tax=Ulvibacter antarcticus TaxID=442714 RepID=A0A3L9ZIL2_9FLAO|nr:hypothetical protein [Ulvibacter antarcticus]RMA66562.1 hypothetical protein BXY75_0989 [Ulvibacter antarcticus]